MVNKKIPLINETFDLSIFLIILRKSIIWAFLILGFSFGLLFLYLRYTSPIYQAKSVLQMTDDDNPTQILRLGEMYNNEGRNIGKTIALMRSKEFIKRCLSHLAFDTRYFVKGTFLNTELYRSTSFLVENRMQNISILEIPIFVEFFSIDSCKIYYENNNRVFECHANTGEWFSLDGNQFKIIVQNYNAIENMGFTEPTNKYFFSISNSASIENEILSNLTIRILSQQTQTIEISYESNNAVQAAEVVNVIAEVFQKYDVEKKGESVQNILAFIDNQLNTVYKNLDKAESEIHSFKKKYNIRDKLKTESPFPVFSNRITEIENEVISVEFELMTLNHISSELSNNSDANIYEMLAMLSGTKSESIVSTMLNSLQRLLQERNNLLYEVTVNNQRIEKIDNQIKSYKRQLVDFLNSSIARLKQRKENFESKALEFENKLFSENGYNEIEYAKLQRLYSINEGFYHQLIQKKAEYMINQASYVPSSTLLEKANVPLTPIAPNKTQVLIITIVLAVVFIFILMIIRYLLYDDIISPETIKLYTNTPIIGIVPNYKKKVPVSQLLVDKRPNSMFTESFRNIRSNLQFLSQGQGSKIVSISSTISGEGKTFVAINLAGIQAISGKKVIILDMDLRKPRLHIGFNVENEMGMSTILCKKNSWQECVKKSDLTGLDFITAGPVPPNPAELAFGEYMETIFEELESEYDIIVVDTPPIGIVTDALINLQRANYPIYVFKSGISKRSFIQNVNNLIEEKKLSNISIVFNGVDFKKHRRTTYGYGYGYGYGYYTDEEEFISSKWLKRVKSFKIW